MEEDRVCEAGGCTGGDVRFPQSLALGSSQNRVEGGLRSPPRSFGGGGSGVGWGSLFHLAHSLYQVRLDRAPICVLGEEWGERRGGGI